MLDGQKRDVGKKNFALGSRNLFQDVQTTSFYLIGNSKLAAAFENVNKYKKGTTLGAFNASEFEWKENRIGKNRSFQSKKKRKE